MKPQHYKTAEPQLRTCPVSPDTLPRTNSGIVELRPEWLNIDAKTFQFKSGGDKCGVTERLLGVNKFDPNLCGIILVWQDKEGHLFLADGHQRHGLAQRAIEAGQENIWLPARIFEESKNYSKEDVRIIAAFKNIAEGTGSTIDVAQIIRRHGMLPDTIPPRSNLVRHAKELARLGEEVFKAVYNKVIPPEQGAVIARVLEQHGLLADESMQKTLLKAMRDYSPVTEVEAELIAREVVKTDRAPTQETLFADDFRDHILKERAEIMETAIKMLKTESRSLRFLLDHGTLLEKYGASPDMESLRSDWAGSRVAHAILRSHSGRASSEISPALNGAAHRLRAVKKNGNGKHGNGDHKGQNGEMDGSQEVRLLLELIDRSADDLLNRHAKELKRLKQKGESNEIFRMRRFFARDFLDAIAPYLHESDLAKCLRNSLGVTGEKGNGEIALL